MCAIRLTERQISTAARKQQLLDEAAKILGERGFFGFGLTELAERCGVTKAGLLHHFGSKEQLLIELLRQRDRHNSIIVAAILGPRNHPDIDVMSRSGLIEILHAIVAQNTAQPEMLRLYAVLSMEALNPRHPAHDYFAARDVATRERFAQMLAAHVSDPQSTALHLLASMKGLEQEWLRTPDAFEMLAEWDAIVGRILP